ncbi:hypothetical protein E7T06_17715 [Deinococcus sp. Arct2-2]|uniref:transposase n=1 Tax=Deinococcus sp. Arct2-2 TaxID=2568653 RepID=UPI0010A4F1DE|nr:transposase [Deinococcus sp. Arct2-2]THF68171.1 hypothetical protein E7T06_17715 [Deinococcus sp. Arct2-2]
MLRTAWAPTGRPFVCPVYPRYEWLYVYAFVNPETSKRRFWIVPTLNQQAYGLVMTAVAQSVGAGQDHHVLIVEDNGGFHVPTPQGHPQEIEIVRLPPYAPERQPVERV